MSELTIPSQLTCLAAENQRMMYNLGIPQNISPDLASKLVAGRKFTGRIHDPDYKPPDFILSNDLIGELMQKIGEKDPSMLLVRPDFYHHRKAFIDYLLQNGFCPHYINDLCVSEESYEQMYYEVFQLGDAIPSFPNRTLVYTNSPATLIVFSDPLNRFRNESLADGFCREYKGKQGVRDGKTLRGSVVFDEAIRLGYDRLEDPTIATAVDPLGSYRELVRKSGTHSYLPPELQMLYYTGVSVHVPNFSEFMRDLPSLCTYDQLKNIYDHLRYPFIDLYKWMWNEGKLTKPLALCIGGYAGTGKSTLAKILSDWLPSHEKMATGQIRSILQQSISQVDNPWLYRSTYQLDQVAPDGGTGNAIEGFYRQVEPVSQALQKLLEFVVSERQHHVFDGNHILPGMINFPPETVGVEFYLKVSDPKTHRTMLGGDSHQRVLTEHEFSVARQLHDHIVKEAEDNNKPVFEYSEGYYGVLELLNEKLRQELAGLFNDRINPGTPITIYGQTPIE